MTTTKVAREPGPTTEPAKPVAVRPEPAKPEPAKPVAAKPAATRPAPGIDHRRVLVGEAVEAALHTYEQAVANFVGFEHKAAEVTRSARTKAALDLHATFLADLTAVYMRTARAVLR